MPLNPFFPFFNDSFSFGSFENPNQEDSFIPILE